MFEPVDTKNAPLICQDMRKSASVFSKTDVRGVYSLIVFSLFLAKHLKRRDVKIMKPRNGENLSSTDVKGSGFLFSGHKNDRHMTTAELRTSREFAFFDEHVPSLFCFLHERRENVCLYMDSC